MDRLLAFRKRLSFKMAIALCLLFAVFVICSTFLLTIASQQVAIDNLQKFTAGLWIMAGLLICGLSRLSFVILGKLDQERMRSITSEKLASLGEISAGVAHEINNPLAVIEAKVYLMQEYLEQNPDLRSLSLHLDKVRDMVQRISKITSSLTYFSTDATQDPATDFSIDSVLNDVQTLCATKIRARGIELKVQIPEEKYVLSGREVQLCQVLINLLQNAMDAAKDQPLPMVEVRVCYKNDHCMVSVIDNGPGVPSNLHEKIFQPFFTTKGVGKGTGLGLSISHGIIKQHGGDLWLNREDGFTKFEFTIPLVKKTAQILVA